MISKYYIFLFFLSINLLFASGHFYFYDEMAMYEVAKSIFERGDFSVPAENVLVKDKKGVCFTKYGFGEALMLGRFPLFGVFIPLIPHENIKGRDGKMYSPFGIGQSIAVIPFYAVGILFSKFFSTSIKNVITEFFVSLFNSFVNALIGTIIFLFILDLGYRFTVALLASIIYEFFTFSFEYSKMFYAEPLITLCLTVAVYFLYRYFNSSLLLSKQNKESYPFDTRRIFTYQEKIVTYWLIFLAGAIMGFGILTKIAFSILLIPIVFYVVFEIASSYLKKENKIKSSINKVGCDGYHSKVVNLFWLRNKKFLFNLIITLLLFLFPIFISFFVVALYNFYRFGNVFETGYGDKVKFNVQILEGLYGLLFSSGKSVFVYSPILIIAIILFPKFLKKHKAEGILFISIFIISLLFYSKWNSWQGGFCWGPRFLLPAIPFLVIPLCEFFEIFDEKKLFVYKRIKNKFSSYLILSLFFVLLFITFFIQIIGISVRFDYIYSHIGVQPVVNSAFEKKSVLKISFPCFAPLSETFKVFKEVTKNTYRLFFSKISLSEVKNYEDIVNSVGSRRVMDFWWVYFYFLGFRKFVFYGVFLNIIVLFFCSIKILALKS